MDFEQEINEVLAETCSSSSVTIQDFLNNSKEEAPREQSRAIVETAIELI